jgi:extracellular elastinolytic metalloproteinase
LNDDGDHPHATFCSQLETEVLERQDLLGEILASQSSEQTVLGATASILDTVLAPLEHLYESNCAHVNKPYELAERDAAFGDLEGIGDPKRALLQFMIAATPNERVLQDILARYDDHLSGMVSSFETHLVGDHAVTVEHIDNVPDTVNPVKTKLAYVQVPKGDWTVLKLVWKVRLIGPARSVLALMIGAVRSRDAG